MNVKISIFFGRSLLGFGLLLSILSVAALIDSGASLREICWHEVSKLKRPGPFDDLVPAPSHAKVIVPQSGVRPNAFADLVPAQPTATKVINPNQTQKAELSDAEVFGTPAKPQSGGASRADSFWEKDLIVPDKTVVEKLDGELRYDKSLIGSVWVCLSMALIGWVILKFHDNHRLKALPLIVGVAPVAASILSALVFYLSLSRPLMIFKDFYSYNLTLPGEVMILFAGLVAGAVLAVVTWSVQAFFPDSSSSNKLQ